MNIYVALLLFSFIILLYWVITELFTYFFRLTGLPDEKARFQVISLLTGTGFTTRESEMILSSRRRRRLARITMLFGYVFNVTFISALINVFISLKSSEQTFSHIVGSIFPLIAIAIIFLFMRMPKVHTWGENMLELLVGKLMKTGCENTTFLLDYIGEDSIVQVVLKQVPELFVGKPLSQTGLKANHNILVMLVDRGKAVPASADTVFQPGDKLTVFGNYKAICAVFRAQEQRTPD